MLQYRYPCTFPVRKRSIHISYDLIVIGGGINGVGIARDAAMRGLKTCLLEQADLCNGTTRWSSRLIHGGLRYLEHGEISLVHESLHEREALLLIAPHLVKPLELLIPIYRGGDRGRLMITAGMWLYELLSMGKSLARHRMLDRQGALAAMPALNPDGLVGAASYFDAQVTFPERLVIENALAAREHGADIRTYSRVDHILVKERRVTGVRYTDLRGDRQQDLSAPVVVNATGPWVDRVLGDFDGRLPRFMGGTKGTHIIVSRFEGAPDLACYVEARSDGRPFFIIPWNGLLLIGTTDIPTDENPGTVRADPRELQYLLDETNTVFPIAAIDHRQILFAYTGIRPLPRQRKKDAGAITRRHIVKHHRRVARGLYSVIGGKLTTYRNLAQEVVDRAERRVRRSVTTCSTAVTPLPGAVGDFADAELKLRACKTMTPESRARLLSIYGGRAVDLLNLIAKDAELAQPLCPTTHTIGAEVPFAFESEFTTTLADVLLRRSMSALTADQGRKALRGAIAVGRRYLGWDTVRADEEERRYLREIERLSC